MSDKIFRFLGYLLLTGAFLFFAIGILEGFLNVLGWTLWWIPYSPFRLLEFSAIFCIFAIFVLLIEIKNYLRERDRMQKNSP